MVSSPKAITVGNTKSFLQAISDREPIIHLNFDELDLEEEIVIDYDVTIVGHNTHIQACQNRHFLVTGGKKFFLKNLTLTDGQTLNFGGSIRINVPNHTLVLENVILENNQANQGGAIYTQGNLILKKCKLSHNSAVTQGGAIWTSLSVTLFDSSLSHNQVTEISNDNFGGGIVIDQGDLTMVNSSIRKNIVKFDEETKVGGSAGAVSLTHGSLISHQSHIDQNEAFSSGGIQLGLGDINLFQSSVSGNKSYIAGDACGGGGIVITSGNVTLCESLLKANITKGMYSGSLVSILGNVAVIDSLICENVNRGPGGAIACNFDSMITVTRSKLLKNTAASLGGAIVNFSGDLGQILINESEISENIVTNEQTIGQTIEAFLSVILGSVAQMTNVANNSPLGGSALLTALENIKAKAENVHFETTLPDALGGGAVAALLTCPIVINRSKFIGNVNGKHMLPNVDSHGYGTLFAPLASVTISQSEFAKNRVSAYASGIFSGANVNLEQTSFQDNKAKEGKSVILTAGDAILTNSKVTGGIITNKGSLVLINTEAKVESETDYIEI